MFRDEVTIRSGSSGDWNVHTLEAVIGEIVLQYKRKEIADPSILETTNEKMADAYFNLALNRLKSSIDSRLEEKKNEKDIVKLLEQTRKDVEGEKNTINCSIFPNISVFLYTVKNITEY